jgi:hypothetical protein
MSAKGHMENITLQEGQVRKMQTKGDSSLNDQMFVWKSAWDSLVKIATLVSTSTQIIGPVVRTESGNQILVKCLSIPEEFTHIKLFVKLGKHGIGSSCLGYRM